MDKKNKLKITFCRGAGSVTGANFLVETDGHKFLIDCGLLQSRKLADDTNWEPFPYDPAGVEALFITHAHVDHIGRIPKLFNDGFRGRIISTIPTKDIARLMLEDTNGILGRDKNNLGKIYNTETLEAVLSLWETLPYRKTMEDFSPFQITLHDAGHILGSAMVEIVYQGKKFLFTGDLGNSPSPLLPDTEKVENVDYLIMESVYGDRLHESKNERRKKLEETIEDNYRAKGTLIIPTFSLERSQELLFEIDSLVENKRVPTMPIFFDSPLGISLTGVYRKYEDYFNEPAKKIISSGDDIFGFPGLKITPRTEESKMILSVPDPKIIIAGSGMSNGGRIIHHEKNYLPNPNNTILLTGYQSLGTLGRQIQDGARSIYIAGEEVPIRARLVTINGYSGHKDADALLNFVEDSSSTLKRVYVVMGEPKSSLFLVQRIRDYLAIEAYAPGEGDSVEIEV